MSFGALSPQAVRALNAGAKRGEFAHDTGEGGVSPYHRENGGDIIWEIGSGYFGCRNRDGTFNPELFAKVAADDQIKMVELKVSQGAKPGHGGVLPAAKVSEEISRIRGVPMGEDCISPATHRAFSTPLEMMRFIGEMRRLSGGKPAGFKMCVGHPWEFLAICKAMLESGIYPDFIVVDGNEGGTGAAPLEFMDHLGMPMREGVSFVHNALIGIGARDRIRIGCCRKDRHCLRHGARDGDRRRLVQFGARLHVRARLHPVAVVPYRPLPDRRHHPGSVPRPRALWCRTRSTGCTIITTPRCMRWRELLAAAGLEHPSQLRPIHFSQRTSTTEVRTFAKLYPSLRPGELLEGTNDPRFREAWAMARADSFAPADDPGRTGGLSAAE